MSYVEQQMSDKLGFEDWLTQIAGVSNDCYEKLKSFGCDSISMMKACTESDIEDISQDTNIKKIDKLKLKVAIKKSNECDDNKHLIIEVEEKNAMIAIDNKIKELQHIFNELDSNEINHIIVESKKCEKQINDTFDKLYKSLRKRHNSLIHKTQHIRDQKKHYSIQKKQRITEYIHKSIHIKQECHKLVNKPTEIEQLNDRKHKLQCKSREVCSIKAQSVNDSDHDIIVFKSYLNSLLKIHAKFGDVHNVEYIDSDSWDTKNKGDHILLHENNKLCINNIDNEYQSLFGCCVAEQGVHQWKLKIIKTTYHMLWNTMIGILINTNKRKVRNTYFTESAPSYAFIGNCAAFIANNDQNDYGSILKNGSVVEVILDCDQHTLKYIIDGKDHGIAYRHIPQARYCLAVTMTHEKDQIQLMSYLGQQYN